MTNRKISLFLVLALVFAAVHHFATIGSLYWHVWWLDLLMHTWGGVLIGFGVHIICSFCRVHIQPSLPVLLSVLAIATIGWELFEWSFGLYLKEGYFVDTAIDIVLGFTGGLLAHRLLKTDTIEQSV